MTPEEKAEELVQDFYEVRAISVENGMEWQMAIQCAIISVKSIIDALTLYDNYTEKYLKEEFGVDYFSSELQNMDSDFRYWHKVLDYLNKKKS